jgi:alkyl sulfatase BDS1-like metallo-beta-lactamase superfamily hydrolase
MLRLTVFLVALCVTVPASAADWKHYNNNPEFELTTLPNGSIANMQDLARAAPVLRMGIEAKAISVTDNIWIISGYAYGPVVIETDKGLLVFSTGEHAEDGKIFRKIIRNEISKKPVIGVFYDHAHYPKGTKTLLDGDEAIIVAHPDHNAILQRSGGLANPNIPELLPNLDARASIHLGNDMPNEGSDAMASPLKIELGQESAWMPATKTVKHGETTTVGGIRIQSFHAITDAEDTLTFWLPDQRVVIDNVVWPAMNLYTLRGDRYRPPEHWIGALRQIRDLQPEIILTVGGGSMPIIGKDECLETTTALMDAMTFIYDQSIRLTNKGVHPKELKHHIQMPTSLNQHPFVNEIYGQFDSFPEANPLENAGWFSGRAEDIHGLPRDVLAKNMVKLAGGADNVLKSYQQAMEKSEYLWAKELAAHLYYSDPGNARYRKALADAFRKLGQYSPGSIVRNFYIAAALSLEGDEAFSLTSVQKADWVKEDPARAVNHLRTRIDPEKAEGVEGVLVFDIEGEVAALHIRNSIAEFVPDPDAHYRKQDASITVSGDEFAAYFRGEISADDLTKRAKTDGDAAKLIGVFDSYVHVPMYP